MSIETTITWLKAASAFLFLLGLVIALAALPATSGPALLMADGIFWPFDGAQSLAAPETRLLAAIDGGVLAGWGVMIWLVSARLYPREPALARLLILAGIGCWFVVDSAGSIAAGAPLNAVLNIGFVLLFAVPLLAPSAGVRQTS